MKTLGSAWPPTTMVSPLGKMTAWAKERGWCIPWPAGWMSTGVLTSPSVMTKASVVAFPPLMLPSPSL